MSIRNIISILFCFCFFYAEPLLVFAQCPGSGSVWKKVLFLRDSSALPSSEKLKILVSEEAKIKNCSYSNDSTHAFILKQIGIINASQGDYLKAIKYLRFSIEMINANINKPAIDPKHLISSYYWLSTFYDSLGQVAAKINALDSCAKITIRSKAVNELCLSSLYKIAEYYFDVGDYQRCIDYATICETLSKEYAAKGNKEEFNIGMWYASSTLSWIVNSFLQLKKYDAAEKILTEKASVYNTELKYSLGVIYEQLAEVQMHNGDQKNALKFYNDALAAENKLRDYPGCIAILNNIGNLYFKQYDDAGKALFYYRKALSYNKQITDKIAGAIESLNVLSNIGDVYVKQKKFDSAYLYFQLAFDEIKPGITETEFVSIPLNELGRQKKIGYLTNNLIDKGDAFSYQYKITKQPSAIREAVRIYKTTDKFLDRIKIEQSDIESKLFWRSDSRRVYEHAIDACYSYNNFEDAFYFFEKSRAVLLNDQLSQLSKISNDDILQQAQISKKILQLQKEINITDASSKNYTELQTGLFSAKQESDRIVQLIKNREPLYYQSFLDTSFITLKDVQTKLLKDHQALVELFNGDSDVYSLIITAQKTYLKKIIKSDYDSTTKKYISFISNAALLNSHYYEFNKIAHHLYQLIFGKNDLPNGRIIISPDGEYFPFESLVVNSNFRSPDYFLNDHAVSYTYSARFLLNDLSSFNSSSKNNFLGVAPVKYVSSLSLPSLNGSDRSLNEIENYFSATDNYVSENATKNNFTNQFSKYKVIQLYTHSSDTSSHNEPVIFFQDSALYLSELIPENKPSTQLIVLSACETANGQLYRGEGVFSFNRGFAALGIPSSITNLWSVDDRSTYKLTELFYKYLAKDLPLDVALQNAKKEFIQTGTKEYSLPYYWAAPVLVGKTDAIEMNSNLSRKNFFFAAVVCLLLFFAVKYFVRKRSVSNHI